MLWRRSGTQRVRRGPKCRRIASRGPGTTNGPLSSTDFLLRITRVGKFFADLNQIPDARITVTMHIPQGERWVRATPPNTPRRWDPPNGMKRDTCRRDDDCPVYKRK